MPVARIIHVRCGNPKSAPWTIGVTYAHWLVVRYAPLILCTFLRCSLACSSDQKNTDFRQKASVMLGSASF